MTYDPTLGTCGTRVCCEPMTEQVLITAAQGPKQPLAQRGERDVMKEFQKIRHFCMRVCVCVVFLFSFLFNFYVFLRQ